MNEKVTKIYVAENKFNDDDKSIVHLITSSSIDRDGDIVVPSGINETNYSKNPVVLFMHNQYYPIGKSLWRKIEKDSNGEYILAKTRFGNTDLAQEVYNLYKDGILNAWSIGFKPDWDKAEKIDKGYKFNEWELLEYSSVSVPANPEALTIAVKELKCEPLKQYFEYEMIKSQLNDVLQFEKRLKDLENEVRNYDFQEIITLRDAILELQMKFEDFTKQIRKEAIETAGNNKNIDKIINEVVAGAVSRIKGDLNFYKEMETKKLRR